MARPGVALLVQRPGMPDAHVHTGTAALEQPSAVDATTVFDTGSVGKQFTAHLVLLSARRKLLRLDRPVSAFLPRFRLPSVTVEDLVRHQGGVRDAESLLSLAGFRDLDHYTADDLLQLAYRQSRRCTEPGTFLYSNTGYLLLAAILRTVHGTELQDLAAHWVFGPLGMASARFVSDPREVLPGAASSYAPTAHGWMRCQRPVALPGPGSLWCSATDLARWLTHLWTSWPAAQRLVHEDEIPYCAGDHAPYLYGPGLYGDGRRPGDESVFHYGHEQGFSAAALLFRSGLRVICLSNHASVHADRVADGVATALRRPAPGDVRDLLPRIVDDALDRSRAPRTSAPDRCREADHTVLGTYACEDVPGTLRLSTAGGSLHLWRRGTCSPLVPTGPVDFRGDGLRLVLPGTAASPHTGVERFTLHLDRAPDLRYRRTTG
ncbi:serine hydrolase domain-containing protein [Streptomyces luteireticuli]|uniref:serine hydrolase domain-containing protein n=1 Tax=Streptomyces luteireticuli TaxID=173858 RepID=UPI003555C2C2